MSNHLPGHAEMPPLSMHDNKESLNVAEQATQWVSALSSCLKQDKQSSLKDLLIPQSWWRDLVGFSFDITTKQGLDSISTYFASSKIQLKDLNMIATGHFAPKLVEMGPMTFIECVFTFTTVVGTGRGVARLTNVGPKEWKAWVVSTQLEKLSIQKSSDKEEEKSLDAPSQIPEEPQVLIIGAGSSGLALAAHLQDMGMHYLVIDRADVVGASWAKRHDSIKCHTPSYGDHLPFLPFPSEVTTWLGKSEILKWLQHYKDTLGLQVKMGTMIRKIQYEATEQRYTVEIQNEQGLSTLRPKHIVQATGLVGHVPVSPSFPGESRFKGILYHAAHHKTAAHIPNLFQKKALVVGFGATGHDIAQDLVNHGAKSVTMVQRTPTFVVSTDSVQKFVTAPYKSGNSLQDADLIGTSYPYPVFRSLAGGIEQAMTKNDEEMLNGLEKAGVALKRGEDGTSFVDDALQYLGRYYIDQGACELIIDGRIKVCVCEEGVKTFAEGGVELADGTHIDADIIILATGYQGNSVDVRKVMGDEVADKVGGEEFGKLDHEQEIKGWWRPTGYPGYWFMTGNFIWARQFAPLLAMQIQAVEEGINKEYYM